MTQHLFDFNYHNPTEIHFGQGRIAQLSDLVPGQARVLLLYGGGSIKRNGVYQQVRQALGSRVCREFSGVEPNPSLETLLPAIEIVRTQQLDFILAVGGGSVIDAGKFLAVAAPADGEAWDFVAGRRPITAALPVGVVLTLPATGSESNGTSVISRQASKEKKAFHSPKMRPKFAVLDPTVMRTLPDRQLANGLVDAFVHACEQYLTYPVGALVQDGYAEAVLRALYRLAGSFERRREIGWCQNLMWAANQALSGLLGLGVPQDWATHAIGRELTALYDIDHARTLSIVQPCLLRQTVGAKKGKLLQMGHAVFALADAEPLQVIAEIEAMYRRLGMPLRLPEAGIVDEQAAERIMAALAPQQVQLRDIDEAALRCILSALCRPAADPALLACRPELVDTRPAQPPFHEGDPA